MSLPDTSLAPNAAPTLHQGRENADAERGAEKGAGLTTVKGSQGQKYDTGGETGSETVMRLPYNQSNDTKDSRRYGSQPKDTTAGNSQEAQTDQVELDVATQVGMQTLGSQTEGVHLARASARDSVILGVDEAMHCASVKARSPSPTAQNAHISSPWTELQSSILTSEGPLSMEDSTPQDARYTSLVSPYHASAAGVIAKRMERTDNDANESQSEIHTIMEQFDGGGDNFEDQETILPEIGVGSSLLASPFKVPPRKSSLEPLQSLSKNLENSSPTGHHVNQSKISYADDLAALQEEKPGLESVRMTSARCSPSLTPSGHPVVDQYGPTSPRSSNLLQKSLPPVPDPEPDLPFDFHRFLEQLRHRTADPVAKYLRSFLIEFGKKQWMVHEQVKIISDFLIFITNKMAQCEVWRDVSDAEFDNAKEGMEKLVMNRLYTQTFSPAIPPPKPIPTVRGKRKTMEKPSGPGRKGQHQEDIERDDVLAQKVRIYGWVREEHLDIAPVGDSGRRFLLLAQQAHIQSELLKIKTYRAPRDKVICVLNCCKVIFGFLRTAKSADTSADSFVPLLIYIVLQANPDHLVSNVQYIMRFRNQDKLGGEAGYYLSSLVSEIYGFFNQGSELIILKMGAIQFIENLDRTALTVSDEDFERNVEAAVSAIAERHKEEQPQASSLAQLSEKSGPSSPEVDIRNSMEAEPYLSTRPTNGNLGGEAADENAAVSGLLRTIKRPLSSIGRIFSEDLTSPQYPRMLRTQELSTHPPETPRRLSPAVFQPPGNSSEGSRSCDEPRHDRTLLLGAEDAAARQASAEAAEAHRIQRAEHQDVVEWVALCRINIGLT
ncbi:MAG: hypothetical protein Q9187_000337 [Circinaria calcarea]